MASALEHFVNNVRTFTTAGNFRELLEYLNQNADVLSKNCNILDNVLDILNVQQHSLGYLYVLLAKFKNSAMLSDNLQKLFKTFIVSCNGEQVRYSLITYAELCHQYTILLSKDIYCVQGIKVLSQAVDKIRLFDSQLTAVHADLCQICLCAKLFKPALQFLDIDITSIAQTDDNNHDSKYFLLYYYYGGMIYTAVKNYERALYFFEVAVTTPALAMSHIMLEAYKKHILLSLLLHGKILPLPKYSPQITSRFMKPLGHTYHELAKCYCIGAEELRKTITKYRDVFVRDENMGLVKQVEASLCKKNIQRLTKTFLTLSLADVASRVKLSGPEEAEKYILKMINSGEIFAKINQKDGMIVFKEDPQHYNTTEMFEKKQDYISKVVELNKKVLKMEEDILLNPMFIKKVLGPNNTDEEVVNAGQPKPSYIADPED